MIVVTGGAGFIGANFVLDWLTTEGTPVLNYDKLTYAGNLGNFADAANDARHTFVQGDINDRAKFAALLQQHQPSAIVHFAAESHVDRSIHGPGEFVQTNMVGTFNLLEETRAYWINLPAVQKNAFRFLHVSTDEVYGSLGFDDPAFTEETAYAPNSPYAASKAGSDHLVRAYHHTYGLPTLTTNCSNNYGPLQFPEKLIPLMIRNALRGQPLPVYGDGKNVRDWLYVQDHAEALWLVLREGRLGLVDTLRAAAPWQRMRRKGLEDEAARRAAASSESDSSIRRRQAGSNSASGTSMSMIGAMPFAILVRLSRILRIEAPNEPKILY